jgi:hypothetical protein
MVVVLPCLFCVECKPLQLTHTHHQSQSTDRSKQQSPSSSIIIVRRVDRDRSKGGAAPPRFNWRRRQYHHHHHGQGEQLIEKLGGWSACPVHCYPVQPLRCPLTDGGEGVKDSHVIHPAVIRWNCKWEGCDRPHPLGPLTLTLNVSCIPPPPPPATTAQEPVHQAPLGGGHGVRRSGETVVGYAASICGSAMPLALAPWARAGAVLVDRLGNCCAHARQRRGPPTLAAIWPTHITPDMPVLISERTHPQLYTHTQILLRDTQEPQECDAQAGTAKGALVGASEWTPASGCGGVAGGGG